MKKQSLIFIVLMTIFIGHHNIYAQENRSKWGGHFEESAINAIEVKQVTEGWSLSIEWEVNIAEVCALPSGWGPVNPTGVATDGNIIYLSADNMAEHYKYDFEGNYLGELTGVAGAGSVVDLNYYDGKFIGGWYSDIIHRYDIANNVYVDEIVASVSNGVMAYDAQNDIIYSCGARNTGYNNPINVMTGNGEMLYSFDRQNNHEYSGLAYDPRVPCLWGLSKNTSSKNTLVQISLPSGEETGVVFEMPDYFTFSPAGKPAGGLSMYHDETNDSYLLTGMVTGRFVWGLALEMDPAPNTDVAVLSMVSPLTSMGLLGDYPIEFRLKNTGTTEISNIPVSCATDGGTPATFTINETIAPGEFMDVGIPLSVEFLNYNDSFEFEITVDYPGDEDPDNNAISYVATSIEPYYYEPNSYCEYGDGILSFELDDIVNHNTGCTNSGYEDYTDMSTNLVIGNTYTAKMATDGPTQSGFMWIDFNNDNFFDNELELVTDQYFIPDGGMHPVEFTIPEGVEPGTYRLRALVEWVLEEFPYYPNAQMDMGYGEMEDYTVIITAESIDLDAGVFEIDMPNIIEPGNMTPSVIVKNYGALECSFEVTATVDGYSSSVQVDNLASKDTKLVEFDTYNAVNGDFEFEFCTAFAGDEIPDNNCRDFNFRVCDQERENVLVEIGTGTWCGFCPGAALGADELVANGKHVSIIEYHGGDNYTITEGLDRISFYDITSYPTSVFDGLLKHEGGNPTGSIYNEMLPLYEAAIEVPSAYTIDVDMTANNDLDYNLNITVEDPIGFADENLKLFAVLTESHIPENWQTLDELNFVARSVYPNGSGTSVDFSSSSTFSETYNVVVSGSYDLDNCKLHVFVQDVETKMVWQSKVFGFDIVGLENVSGINEINLYPNPTNGIVQITSDNEILDITIYNINGSEVYHQEGIGLQKSIDLKSLHIGFYTFKIRTNEGVFTKKLILNND